MVFKMFVFNSQGQILRDKNKNGLQNQTNYKCFG